MAELDAQRLAAIAQGLNKIGEGMAQSLQAQWQLMRFAATLVEEMEDMIKKGKGEAS
jgi:hypothetical protein